MAPIIVIALLVAAVAAYVDVRTGHIPDWLTGGSLALGVLWHTGSSVAHGGADAVPLALATSVGGALLAGAVPIILHRAGALGGGDVKLFAALGALLGPMAGLEAQLSAFVCAALFVPFYLAYRGQLLDTLARSVGLVSTLVRTRGPRPALDAAALTTFRLGPAIFAGTLWTILGRWAL